ncbi:uncharacterized protein LOC111051741 [Nilaparvata lugens]|uniref:uncharacterized protein LOC111051741 n=1 Tax=Nilaparvata lugens TaxID=108931 RepID=UPI00193E9677|nr:uncharacterized protein LOC111051741 [Nilaparvata lugens]
MILGGDMNIHLQVEDEKYSIFKYLLQSHGLFITNREPTRGSSCLDTIATSLNTWEYEVTVVDPVIADHDAVVMDLHLGLVSDSGAGQPDTGPIAYRTIRADRLPLFKAALDGVDWSNVLNCYQPENAFGVFFESFMDVFNSHFPLKARTSRKFARNHGKSVKILNDKSWYTPRLAQIRNLIVALHARMGLIDDEGDRLHLHNQYLRAKSIYRAEVDAAKRAANMSKIESAGNPCKAAWDLINQISKDCSRPKCKATPDEFNSFFIGEVEKIVASMNDVRYNAPGYNNNQVKLERWKEVRPADVVRVIRGFKNSHSPDVHGVTVGVLKCAADGIALPLSHVLNVCMRHGCFPDVLKLSRTIPVFKKGDPESMNNYRPISIIPVLGKVFEVLMKEQLVFHFERNNLFSDAQHGFRSGRSKFTAVSEMIDFIVKAFEERDLVHLVLADLSKAFDCVPH